MRVDLKRTLRLKISFGRNPQCLDTGGTIEHWVVTVWEVTQGSTRYPYSVEAELEWIDIPDRYWPKGEVPEDPLELERFWENVRHNQQDGYVLCGHHREVIPGVHLTPTSIENFSKACTRARELALVISGYMLMDMLPTVEKAFDGAKWNSPKKPKLKKAVPTGEGREKVQEILTQMGNQWREDDTLIDEEYYRSALG